jgi:5-methylcytosine-specific restriction endonuclease McrA
MNQLFREKPPLVKQKVRGRPAGSSESGKGRAKSETQTQPKRKAKIPAAIQEAIWILKMGRVFEGKCLTTWCPNIITVFDYHAGHDIPESKGGPPTVENLYPICARCNLSMGDRYTLKEWCAMSPEQTVVTPSVPVVVPKKSWWCF